MKRFPNPRFSFAVASTALGLALLPSCSPKDDDSGDVGGRGGSGGTGEDGGGSGSSGGLNGSGGVNLDIGQGGSVSGGLCGDGALSETEACDDGNDVDGDGCAADCRSVETGFICRTAGEPCAPFTVCGDGRVDANEQCDDGETEPGDGCSELCQFEIGFKCAGEPSACSTTTCGDFIVEGAETCDDGNAMPFDGCSPECQQEPQCEDGPGCTSSCGDGLHLPFKDGAIYERCDDGNQLEGDGCSSTCEIEPGFDCDGGASADCEMIGGECVIRVPAFFRDFAGGHPDMYAGGTNNCQNVQNLVLKDLDGEGKPQRNPSAATDCIASDASFGQWFQQDFSASPVNATTLGELVLFETSPGSGTYVNRADNLGTRHNGQDGDPRFFPLEGLSTCNAAQYTDCRVSSETGPAAIPPSPYGGDWNSTSGAYNFHFTSDVTYWFKYDAATTANLDFTGDDDVWVFINGKLAVDLGGMHVPLTKGVQISFLTAADYGLIDGNLYEIRVFHAERRPVGSSFKLTLSGFNIGRSYCRASCGDGIISGTEQCDDGVAGNAGGYNACQPDCTLSGYCGDGIVQDGEQCDQGAPDAPTGCAGCRVLRVK